MGNHKSFEFYENKSKIYKYLFVASQTNFFMRINFAVKDEHSKSYAPQIWVPKFWGKALFLTFA